jgi:lysophospholipase L1-like esterase
MHRTRNFAVEYVIDAAGFRDGHERRTDVRQTRTIAIYGDSFVFGWGVPQSDRFTDVLDVALGDVDVLNRGVPGYGLDQQVLSYSTGTAASMEAVMFFVTSSTLARMRQDFIYAKYKPMFVADPAIGLRVQAVPGPSNRALDLVYRVLSPFYLPYFVQNRLSMLKLGAATTAPSDRTTQPRFVDSLVEQVLLRAQETARERAQRMSLLVGDVTDSDHEALRQFCARNDIGFIDVAREAVAAVSASEMTDLVLGPDDRHWNSKGHHLVASDLETRLTR